MTAQQQPSVPAEKPLGDILDVDEIHVEFAGDLIPLALDNAHGVEPRVKKIRRYIAQEFGFIIPPIRLTDNADLERERYTVKIQGVLAAQGTLYPDRLLVIADNRDTLPIDGDDTEEPVYGAPARWITEDKRDEAASLGLSPIEPAEIISTHLLETIKENFARLVTRRAIRRIFDEYANVSDNERGAKNAKLIDEFIPDKIPIEFAQAVFRLLLAELVPIKNLPVILEAIADGLAIYTSPEDVTEFVRQRIAGVIIAKLKQEDGVLPLIQVDLSWEKTFQEYETTNAANQIDVALPPEEFNRLAHSVHDQVNEAAARNVFPAIITTAHRRRFIRTVLHAKKIRNPVLAYDEIDPSTQPLLIGTV